MARPQKEGIDYFALDVDMDQDDKIILLEARHGVQGFGILIKLLMKIYKEGYFYKWTEREQLLFSSRINVDINLIIAVVNDALKWDIFEKSMFDAYEVLTSKGIQKRYLEAIKRRKELVLTGDYLLIPVDEIKETLKIPIKIVNVNKNPINVSNNELEQGLMPAIIPKVKESKEKDSKEHLFTHDQKEILDVWNSLGIVVHGESANLQKEIAKALKSFGKDKVILSIQHYYTIFKDKDFYYSHTWTLEKFCKQKNGIPDFLDDGARWIEYVNRAPAGDRQPRKQGKNPNLVGQGSDKFKDFNL